MATLRRVTMFLLFLILMLGFLGANISGGLAVFSLVALVVLYYVETELDNWQ